MSGDNEKETGFFDGSNRLPDDAEPLHALHRPYQPDKERDADDDQE